MQSQATIHHDAVARRFPGRALPLDGDRATSLHLYHAANSICSQKVRAVLVQTGLGHESHIIDIFRGENYDPDYVRLRAQGCAAAGLPLASTHPGSTSVAAGGCDACVVPTLVDLQSDRVLVDSRRICEELCQMSPAFALMPEPLRARIDEELAIIDNLPNYQILAMGVGHAAPGELPNAFARGKVARCDALLQEHAEDPLLQAAYGAKRAKEQMAAERLFDAAALAKAYRTMGDAVEGLQQRLERGQHAGGRFLLGDRLTLADLFWGVELIRFEDLGMAVLWQHGRRPDVERYYDALCAEPAMTQAVLTWPGARLPRRPDVPLETFAASDA